MNAVMRFSPTKTTVVCKENPLSSHPEYKKKKTVEDVKRGKARTTSMLASHQLGIRSIKRSQALSNENRSTRIEQYLSGEDADLGQPVGEVESLDQVNSSPDLSAVSTTKKNYASALGEGASIRNRGFTISRTDTAVRKHDGVESTNEAAPIDIDSEDEVLPEHEAYYEAGEGEDLSDRVVVAPSTKKGEEVDDIEDSGGSNDPSILVDDYGRPLVNRLVAQLPDPRYRETAHGIFCFLWYGGMLMALLYTIITYSEYNPTQTKTFPFTSTLNPIVNLRVVLSCTSDSASVTRVNYSIPDSKCFNMTATHIPSPNDEEGGHGHTHSDTSSATTARNFEEQAHHLPNDFNPQLPPVRWLKADAPAPLIDSELFDYDNAETLVIPLCSFPDTPYDSQWYWPEFPGPAVMYGNISYDEVCSMDIYDDRTPLFFGGKEAAEKNPPPLKRISVEGQVLKTVWIHYTERRAKHDDDAFLGYSLDVTFYEMDATRTFTDDTTNTSIIRFRFTDTSTIIHEFDSRGLVHAAGVFGSVWYLVSKYFCFYAAPLLIFFFPRDFIADAEKGKLDTYTALGLAQAWRASVWLWAKNEIVRKVKILEKRADGTGDKVAGGGDGGRDAVDAVAINTETIEMDKGMNMVLF